MHFELILVKKVTLNQKQYKQSSHLTKSRILLLIQFIFSSSLEEKEKFNKNWDIHEMNCANKKVKEIFLRKKIFFFYLERLFAVVQHPKEITLVLFVKVDIF